MTSQSIDPHIRLINLRKDLTPVANLVEECFAEHMDAEGKAYIQHIRRAGHDERSYYLDAFSPEASSIPFHGYVWEEEGKIIGNATLIFIKKSDRNLYFIANVAVKPEFRNRGIARKLTERAIKHIKEHGGKSVVLQVREDNPAAIHIYESLGFDEITRRTNWVPERVIPPMRKSQANILVTWRKAEDWPQQKTWLEEIYPDSVALFLPFQITKHEPGLLNQLMRWLDSESIKFLAARDGDHLIGLASLETINPFQDYLWLATSPAFEESAIFSLVTYILHHSRHPQKIQVNYPAHRADSVFKQAGMTELNTLIWMENKLSNLPNVSH